MSYAARFPTESIQKKFLKELNLLPNRMQTEIWSAIHSLEKTPRPYGAKPFRQLKPPVFVYPEFCPANGGIKFGLISLRRNTGYVLVITGFFTMLMTSKGLSEFFHKNPCVANLKYI